MMGLSENEATDDPLDFESARERYDPFVLNRKAEASADDDGSEFLSRRVEQSHCVFFGNRVPLADDGLVENIGHEPLDDEPLDLPSMPWRR